MDALYLGLIAVFFLATAALLYGCNHLERST
jgi:hypothetical protein